MLNIKFPETNIVTCVFSLKNGACHYNGSAFNEYDYLEDTTKLKEYYYRVPDYLQGKLAPGTFVVVYCQTGYQVCQVNRTNVTCAAETEKLAPVVATVDLGQYFANVEMQKQLKYMEQELRKERKRLEEQVTWDLIAEKNPEFAQRLKAFRDMGGQL